MRIADFFYLFIILFVSLLVCGCDSANYDYTVVVSGLENYTSNGTTVILVPLPVVNGTPIFTNEEALQEFNRWKDNDWEPRIINTEKGKMLSLNLNKKKLTVAGFRMTSNLTDHPYNESERAILLNNTTFKYPFYPVIEQSSNYTPSVTYVPYSMHYSYKYMTYVYIDENLVPLPGKGHTIKIYSVLTIDEGSSSDSGVSHSAMISEEIPEGGKGWVPVTVYVL